MPRRVEWLPAGLDNQLDMAVMWRTVLGKNTEDARGKHIQNWEAWGISPEQYTEFLGVLKDAEAARAVYKNPVTETKVSHTEYMSAYKALVGVMRYMKKKWFHIPPLSEVDFASLGLKVPRKKRSRTGTPDAEVFARFRYEGQRQISVLLDYISGDPNDPSNKLFVIYQKIIEYGEEVPAIPDESWTPFITTKRKELFDFKYTDSGKKAVFSVRIVNGMKKGPWGPINYVVIP